MWEYKMICVKYVFFQDLINELDKYGEEGWEIIYYQESKRNRWDNETEVKILFKRKK